MEIANLFAGLNGIFKNVDDHHITHVEINEDIAAELRRQHPDHTVVVDDAMQFIEKHFTDFDYIHASPPCDEWTNLKKWTRHDIKPRIQPFYLYRMIYFLKDHVEVPWTVENVFHRFLVKPDVKLGRNYFWSNMTIPKIKVPMLTNYTTNTREELTGFLGFDYRGNIYDNSHDPLKVLRRCVHPDIGDYLVKLVGGRSVPVVEGF